MSLEQSQRTKSPNLSLLQSRILVSGFIRFSKWMIPKSVFELILDFYPRRYRLYDLRFPINSHSHFAWNRLNTMSSCHLLDDPQDIYQMKSDFIFKTVHNEIYYLSSTDPIDHGIARITGISNGLMASHIIMVSAENIFYGFGPNEEGQFGDGWNSVHSKSTFKSLPKLSRSFSSPMNRVIQISCGSMHTLFLTNRGRVWSAGKNTLGQCGIKRQFGSCDPLKKYPVLISKMENIIDIQCGMTHNLCISKHGDLWTFGSNGFGECGVRRKMVIDVPRKHLFFDDIKIQKIRCGRSHSMVIAEDGSCWMFGRNVEGQIGNGNHGNGCNVREPLLFQNAGDELRKRTVIRDGSCGLFHTVLMTNRGQLWIFGSNSECEKVVEPLLIRCDFGKVIRLMVNYKRTIVIVS